MIYTLPDKAVIDTHTPTGVKIYGYTVAQMRDAYEQGCVDTQKEAGTLAKLKDLTP